MPQPSDATYFESDLSLLPGIHIPLRSMLVASGNDAILVSPLGTDEECAVARQTRVTLVAPSLLHHKYIARARAQLDVTELWAPPGFAAKKPELGPVKTFDVHRWPHQTTLPYVVVAGAPLRNEVVFFHPPTRTIYTADLVFNIRSSAGLLSSLSFRAMGIYRRFAVARMWKRWVKDRAAFRKSIDQILAWDFERIAMAHGELVTTNGRERLAAALRERDLY
jgi:hypothetical protein